MEKLMKELYWKEILKDKDRYLELLMILRDDVEDKIDEILEDFI
jgi:hypothetical protein